MEREAKFGMLVDKGMRKGRGYAPGPRQRRGFCLGPRRTLLPLGGAGCVGDHHVLSLDVRAVLEVGREPQDPRFLVLDRAQGPNHLLGVELQVEVLLAVGPRLGALPGLRRVGDGPRERGGRVLYGPLAQGLRRDPF